MANYSAADRVFIIQKYYKSESVHSVQVAWKLEKKTKTAPKSQTIQDIIKRFEEDSRHEHGTP